MKCPVCFKEGNKEKFGLYVKCSLCQTLFLIKPPKKKIIQKTSNLLANTIINRNNKKTLYVQKKRIKTLNCYLPKKSTVLDVGCGNGLFLELAKSEGLNSFAMDISPAIIKHLKNKGIEGYTNMSEIPNNKFNAITSFDVIEHTTNPDKFIKDMKKKLKKDGFIMITTPNLLGISGKILKDKWWVFGAENHFILFSPTSLKIKLKNNGFKIIYYKTDLLTQWFIPNNTSIKKILNKIQYMIFFPIQKLAAKKLLGDNIEILAKKNN